jgi:hypothetical protein
VDSAIVRLPGVTYMLNFYRMKFIDFILSSNGQQDLAIRKAVLVAARVDPPFHYSLLQLDSFYIELVHDEITHRTSVNAFENLDKLDPYLIHIPLP